MKRRGVGDGSVKWCHSKWSGGLPFRRISVMVEGSCRCQLRWCKKLCILPVSCSLCLRPALGQSCLLMVLLWLALCLPVSSRFLNSKPGTYQGNNYSTYIRSYFLYKTGYEIHILNNALIYLQYNSLPRYMLSYKIMGSRLIL